MEKFMTATKRLLAMLLVFAMIVAYIPAGAFAEEVGEAQTNVTSLSAKLTREEQKVTEPTEPTGSEPTDPAGSEPTDPAGSEPTDPAGSEPTEPAGSEPTEPAGSEPTEPAGSEPTEPAGSEPTEPAGSEPTEPAGSEPTEPAGSEPTEPAGSEPTDPAESTGATEETRVPSSASALPEEGDTDDGAQYVYKYTVAVKVGNQDVDSSGYSVVWTYIDEKGVKTEIEDTDKTTPNVLEDVPYDDVTAEVTYEGVKLSLTYSEGSENEIVVTATKDNSAVTSAIVGVPFDLPKGVLVANVEGLVHDLTLSGNAVKTENNTAYATEEGTVTLTETWSANGVVYASNTYTVNAAAVIPQATLTVKGGEAEWYSEAQTVVVEVENSIGLVSTDFLPAVTLGETEYTNWKSDFTMEIPVGATGTVTYAKGTDSEQSIDLKIDMTPVAVEILRAFDEIVDGNEVTTVQFEISVGKSKLTEVTVNGAPYDLTNAVYSGDDTFTLSGEMVVDRTEKVIISATNGAGVTETLEWPENPQPALEITFLKPETVIGTGDDNRDYVSEGTLTIQVTGAANDSGDYQLDESKSVVEAFDQDGTAISGSWAWSDTEKTWSYEISLANGLKSLSVTAADSYRTVTEAFGTQYGVDTTPPEVTVSRSISPVNTYNDTEYYNAEVTYSFTIEDVLLGDNNTSKITYTINGTEKSENFVDGKAEFTVKNGEKLTSIVVTAVDASGNVTNSVVAADMVWDGVNYECSVIVDTEAPDVDVVLSENVKYIYDDGENIYAVLDPMDTDSDNESEIKSETVTLTVTVEDENLDLGYGFTAEGAEWKINGTTATAVFEVTVDDYQTGRLAYKFSYKDLADNCVIGEDNSITVTAHGTEETDFLTGFAMETATAGSYEGVLRIDRRAPGTNPGPDADPDTNPIPLAPVIELTTDAGNGTDLYSGSFSYEMTITDLSQDKYDSGVKNVTWSIEDGLSNSFLSTNTPTYDKETQKGYVTENGIYTIDVTANGNNETNDAVLTVIVEDFVGNQYTYYKRFAVDTKAPDVNVTLPEGATNGNFYNNDVEVKVDISDINLVQDLDIVQILVNGENVLTEDDLSTDISFKVTATEDDEYTVVVKALDLAGNEAAEQTKTFIIDTVTPVVTITSESDTEPSDKTDGYYYSSDVTYTVTVSDKYLDNAADGTQILEFTYTLENGNGKTFSLPVSDDNLTAEGYTYSFTLVDGDVLTGMSVQVTDNAGNPMEGVTDGETDREDFVNEEGIWTYTDKPVIVDSTSPAVVVTKTIDIGGSLIQTYTVDETTYAYYDQTVTYGITVTDKFLNTEIGTVEVTAIYTDGTTKLLENTYSEEQTEQPKLGDEDKFEFSVTVDDEKVLKSIEIKVIDNKGNVATIESPTDTKFEVNDDGVWAYNGDCIVVDTVVPAVEMIFSSNVDSFYRNGDTIYMVLTTPVKAESGEDFTLNTVDPQEVTVTINITDKNLVVDNAEDVKSLKYNEELDFEWVNTVTVNESKTFTYTASSGEIGPDGIVAFKLDVNLMDMAGHIPEKFESRKTVNEEGDNFLTVTPDENGHVAFNFVLDRERPSSGRNDTNAPVITVTPVLPEGINLTKNASGNDLFNGAFSFALSVSDGHQESNINSGVKYVKWQITDDNGVVKNIDPVETLNEDGNYTIDVDLAGDPGESNEVLLQIWAEDNVGNLMTYSKTFGVDTLAPRINVAFTGDSGTNGYFYNDDRNVSVTIEDLNLVQSLEDIEVLVNNKQYLTAKDLSTAISYAYTFTQNGEYQMQINALDLAGWTSANTPGFFIMDYDAPVVSVVKETEGYNQSSESVDYYSKEVTYTVTISDAYLSNTVENNNVQVADFSYTLEDGNGNTVKLPASADGWKKAENDTYTYTFTVTDGQVLTGMTIASTDNAGNSMEAVKVTDAEGLTTFANIDGVWTYTGKQVAVDTTAPVVTVTEAIEADKKYIQTYEGYDYYNGMVTYTVEVADSFLNANLGTAELVVTYLDGTEDIVSLLDGLMSMAEDLEAGADTYKFDIVVNNDKVLTGVTINVKDNAGNTPEEIKVVEGDGNALTKFVPVEDSTAFAYEGNGVVSDSVKPEVALEFSSNVKSFYYNTKNNTIYVILNTPSVGASGETLVYDPQSVTVTITVNDKNLTLDSENVNGMQAEPKNGFAWQGETPVNEETTITLVASSASINTDGTTAFIIDAGIIDLAGNIPEDFTSETTNDGETVLDVDLDDKGRINYNVSLDRLRPSSGKMDVTAPTIEVVPVNITPTTTSDGLDLFANAFQFALHITDGEQSVQNSGVKYVKWTVTDENGVVANDSYEVDYSAEGVAYAEDYLVDVALAVAAGESNEVTLNIVAEDFVGNRITFEKVFGVDNLAPRVTITQSNPHAENGFYFNQDQVVTVEIEDLNFEATTSSVTTEVPFDGWQSVGGNVYRTVLTYNVDGDYTFAMATKDRAENEATIDYITGLTSLPSFTIDKTAPIITVTYNPAVPVDTDGNAVQYFDALRTVTVTITEHNFRAADVVANLGAANSLGQWGSFGDVHTATDTFMEGNGYSVSVNYTDLAGNHAVGYMSPTFSIDLNAPTITMTQGSVENGQPISGDLVLGYTVNDAQDNLKDFTVEVMFLDSNFQLQKITGAEYYTVTEGDRTNGYVDFTNIAAEKLNDGIYTVRITARDYAGHVVNLTPDLVFSLNRFGSTFTVNDTYTANFLSADSTGVIYRNQVTNDLVIKEVNPDRVWQDTDHTVEGSAITISVNGNAITLENGVDYEVSVTEMGSGAEKWYEYTYTIKSDVFSANEELVDGEYTLFFYSEDEAGNMNSNESNEGSALQLGAEGTYSGKVSFTLDHKDPVVTILGIEADKQYFEANKSVEIDVSDNTPVSVTIYVNDELVEVVEAADGLATTSDWFYYDKSTGTYKLNLSEKNVRQNVRIVVVDAAGNDTEIILDNIMLTESLWYQYINSLPAVLTSIVGTIGIIVLIVALIKKRKKNPAEAAQA